MCEKCGMNHFDDDEIDYDDFDEAAYQANLEALKTPSNDKITLTNTQYKQVKRIDRLFTTR